MNYLENISVLWKEKSWKKLTAFSVFILLIIVVIVFLAAIELSRSVYLDDMNEYLGEIPQIYDSRQNEFLIRSQVYNKDILSRAELGLLLFGEDKELTDVEKLNQIRDSVSAASISMLDENGQMLSTTGPVTPEEKFSSVIKTLEPRVPHLEFYPALSENGEEIGEDDGKGFVLLSVPGSTKHSLVFEFPCVSVLELHNVLGDWTEILARMLSSKDLALAFAKTGDKLVGYPLDDLTAEQTTQLHEEIMSIFRKSNSFRRSGKIITILGDRYFAAYMNFSQGNTDILLAVPLKIVIINIIFVAVVITAIIGWGIILSRIYIFRCLRREKNQGDLKEISRKQLYRQTWPGILVVVLVTVIFSSMLLALENRATASITAMNKRESVKSEIEAHRGQEKTIRSTYVDSYRTRAQILADFLTEHPDHRTRKDMMELNRIAGTEYLMLFDGNGQEYVSSNSYSGFSVDKNLSDEYQAVLMGYPSVVVGPAADSHTGQIQLGTAIMMKDEEGLPDGFLLAVYSAGDLDAELKRMSYENTVNSFAVRKGHISAAINEEDGRFIAHTDPDMIGLKAENYLPEYQPGNSFEGFNNYKGVDMCISASSENGKTLLFMVPEHWNSYEKAGVIPILLVLGILTLLALLYYPNASLLIAKSIEEADKNLPTDAGKGSRIRVFYDGYDIYLTLFTLFVLIASSNGWWKSFDYVLSGKWSKGVHLYSIWAVLFIVVGTLCIGILSRTFLDLLESRLSLRGRTVIRLIKSLISYMTVIFLVFSILDLFGVNTTTMLASAGVLSIAIGMGAKSMAEDLLAGVFMMAEGTVHVGDNVSVGNVTGCVTDMGIRTTEITDEQGNVVILNNSKVSGVRNMSRKDRRQEPEDPPKNK